MKGGIGPKPTDKPSTATPPADDGMQILTVYEKDKRHPVMISKDGHLKDLASKFVFDKNGYQYKPNAYKACQVVYKGKMLVMGGPYDGPHMGQISEVSNCKLTKIGTHNGAKFASPTCAVYKEKVFICFGAQEKKDWCWT